MATLIGTIVASARTTLIETSASYWSDPELLELAQAGVKDLWKKIIDLGKDHFVTIDSTNVAIAASTSALTGVPADVFRVIALQPRTLGITSSNRGLIFKPRELNHPDWVQSESADAVDPANRVIYYAIVNAGAPVGAPAIYISPCVTAAVLCTLKYIPTLADLTVGSTNPIPGESDIAIKHYIIAFARSKEREDRAPDPEHLSIYATEARNLLTVLTPRSIQEPEYVVGMWEHDDAGAG
jgi:hypothetical protein